MHTAYTRKNAKHATSRGHPAQELTIHLLEAVTIQRHAQYPGINILGYIRSHSTRDTELNLRQHPPVDYLYVFARERGVLTTSDRADGVNTDRILPTTTPVNLIGRKCGAQRTQNPKHPAAFQS